MLLHSKEKIITILERTLNLVNNKLLDHGKRVSHRVFKKLNPLALYSDKELRDICMLALLHDVGAYKTEDVDDIFGFDLIGYTWNHSIYGYLFIKHFSPLKDLAPVLLYHHAKPAEKFSLSDKHRYLSTLIHESDREDIEQLISGNKTCSADDEREFYEMFSKTPFSKVEIEGYIKMVVYCIDFRSPQTLLHTFAASFVAESLAVLAGVSAEDIENVRTGAMLHDIGKMGTPLHILESTSKKLTSSDMEIMRDHIIHSRKVLHGNVNQKIFDIAVNHHERLTGNGYPRGLKGDEIPFLDGLMAVADLFSALCVSRSYQSAKPKEEALEILQNMKTHQLLNPTVLDLAISNYDEITKNLYASSLPVIKAYEEINSEMEWLREKVSKGDFEYRAARRQ